jgi:hypothetical protein
MKKRKSIFPTEHIIQANLSLQTIQRELYQNYKIYKPELETILSNKFISNYKNWSSEAQDSFIKTIAGKVNFKKVKYFFQKKIGELSNEL